MKCCKIHVLFVVAAQHESKIKMAAAAILNLLPVSIFSILSSLYSGWACSCKISCLYVNIWLSY